MIDQSNNDSKPRKEWVEPEVRELEVRETAFGPGTGGDGDTLYPDCSLS